MLIHLHKQATTTPKVHAAIQASDEAGTVLAERFGVTPQTVYKWRKRDSVEDRSHTPHRLQTTLTPAQEAVAVALRTELLVSLDDLMAVVREFLNATTIHKAQGMTVDRSHVLATPGLDAHASYVALSRHRDGVELHYGRDDFATPERLARTLGRERAKDMALDHAGADPAEDFAARRGIDFGPHAPEPPDTTPQPDDLAEAREAALRPARTRALIRHAEAIHAVFDAQAQGAKASPEQVRHLNRTRDAFETLRPHGWCDAEAAYVKDPTLARDASKGQLSRAIRALQLETELRTDPRARADCFVERWQQLDRRSSDQYRTGDDTGYEASRKTMSDMARSLERDPQMESILANRKRALGLDPSYDSGRRLGRELAFHHDLEITRSRGLGL